MVHQRPRSGQAGKQWDPSDHRSGGGADHTRSARAGTGVFMPVSARPMQESTGPREPFITSSSYGSGNLTLVALIASYGWYGEYGAWRDMQQSLRHAAEH